MKKHVCTLRYVSLFFGVIVIISTILPVFTYENTTYLGHEIIFGKEILNINPFDLGTIAKAWIPFSWVALTAFSLPIISGVLVIMHQKYAPLSLLLVLTSLFMMLSLPNGIVLMYQLGNSESSLSVAWEIAYGLIIAIGSVLMSILTHFWIVVSTNSFKLKA